MYAKDFITIVSGLPRSGTSLLMQMLKAGGMDVLIDEQRIADNDNPRGYLEYEPVKYMRSNADWMPLAAGKAVKVIHALLPNLPSEFNYKVVFVNRDISEVVASQAKMLARAGRMGAQLPPEKLMSIFAAERDRILNWVKEKDYITLIDCNYRELIENPLDKAKDIADFLGLELDCQAMTDAVDKSLYRNRI